MNTLKKGKPELVGWCLRYTRGFSLTDSDADHAYVPLGIKSRFLPYRKVEQLAWEKFQEILEIDRERAKALRYRNPRPVWEGPDLRPRKKKKK